MSTESAPSSPDPLAPSPVSSPVKLRPLASRSSNIISSPSKSIVFQTGNGDAKSPLRIRVTVQAEPEIDRSPIRQRTRTTKVPLKGPSSSSPAKKSARKPSKPATPGIEGGAHRKPKPRRLRGTPVNARESRSDEDQSELDNSYYMSSATRSGDELRSLARRLSTGRKQTESASPPLLPFPNLTQGTVAADDAHQLSVQRLQDENMWRAMINKSAEGADLLSFVEHDGAEYSLSEEESEEEDAMLGAEAPGDATVMESEGFSIISVDSLPSSRHSAVSSLAPLTHQSQQGVTEAGDRSYADTGVSFMPSSPPVLLPRLVTPLINDRSPVFPGAPEPASIQPDKIASPLRQSTVLSSSALQDALRSPERPVPPPRRTPPQNSIFGGFGSGTRRKLQASLQIGEHLATPPPETTQGKDEDARSPKEDLQTSETVDQYDSLSLTIHYRSKSFTLLFPTTATITDLSSTIAADLSIPPENQKFLISSMTGLQRPPFKDPGLALSNLASKKITLMGNADRTQSAEHRLPTPDEREHSISHSSSVKTTREVQYPNLTKQLEEMNLPASQSNYDAMSWIPTGLPKVVSQKWAAQDISTDPASPNKNRSRDPQGQNQTATEQDDGDIWQEEASRSIEEDQPTQESLQPGDLFLDDLPVKPRRSKLPRTWRRTSGHDFHYSDSPEPEALEIRKLSEPTTAESRIGSEAMTPTTTEDEQRLDCSDDGSEEEIREHPSQTNNRVLSPFSDSGGSATDVDDTGCFWQSNMPSVCGGREESGLCNENLDVKRPSHNAFTVSYLEGGLDSSPLRDTVIESSPVKHNQAIRSPNLPRSSKIRTSPLASSSVRQTEVKSPGEVSDSRVTSDARQLLNGLSARQPASGTVNHSSDRSISEVDTSHESSVASDARQLMNELAEQQRRTVVEILASEEELTSVMTPSEDVWEEETERSYEENLNRNSTVRVAVNFNDSTLDSSLLVPKKAYSPLFGNVPDSRRPPASAPAEPEQSSGIFSRFTSFWSTAAKPASKPAVLLDGISEASTRSSDKSSPLIHGIPDTTLRLRRKYGLLPDVFPFTYRHVRTLHRMMNSSRFHALTCIIPRSGPLPAALAALPGAKKTNSLGQEFTWDEPSLQVVAGFMSLLLPAAERMRLGEAGEWGDEQARAFKGLDSRGRHGDDIVYPNRKDTGKIEMMWIASLLIDIVWREERAGAGWKPVGDEEVLRKVNWDEL